MDQSVRAPAMAGVVQVQGQVGSNGNNPYLLNLHHTGRKPLLITDLGDSVWGLVTAPLLVVTNGAF